MEEPTYTIFVRVPIPRGDFVDPPPVNWDSRKDEDLWNILSREGKTEINWTNLASRFEVTVEFLLQQVSYLTDRHASQLRAQLRKATAAAKGSAPSPIPGETGGGAVLGHQRAPSALSVRRDSPLPRMTAAEGGSGQATPIATSLRPNISRTASGNATTTVLAHNLGGGSSSPRPGVTKRPVAENTGHRRRLSSLPTPAPQREPLPEPQSPGPAESSSADSSGESSPAQSRIIRRPPRYGAPDTGRASDGDEDDDDTEPAFAAFKPQRSSKTSADLGATLKGDPREFGKRPTKNLPPRERPVTNQSQTSDSSTSSAALVGPRVPTGERRPAGPLSPWKAAEIPGRSPGSRGKGYSREGSEGTPSMGSSFSDLDDASVTQSALEEALASKMQDGAIGSRFSISQAFRSRYVSKPSSQNQGQGQSSQGS